jgi:hypothetical protein
LTMSPFRSKRSCLGNGHTTVTVTAGRTAVLPHHRLHREPTIQVKREDLICFQYSLTRLQIYEAVRANQRSYSPSMLEIASVKANPDLSQTISVPL